MYKTYFVCGSLRTRSPAPPLDVFVRILSITQWSVFLLMFGENSMTKYESKCPLSSGPLSSSDVVFPAELDWLTSSTMTAFFRCLKSFCTDVIIIGWGAKSSALVRVALSACNWIWRWRRAGGISTVFVSILQANNWGEISFALLFTGFGAASFTTIESSFASVK